MTAQNLSLKSADELADVPILDIDPYSEAFLTAPYPFHAEIRDAGPVVWLSKYQTWAIARFSEMQTCLKDFETFCSSAGVGLANFKNEEPFRPPSIVLEADPPDHTRTRGVIGRAMSQKSVSALKEDFEQDADVMLDALVERGDIDGVQDLAIAYPLKVFPDAVGIGEEGRENLLVYGNMVFNAVGPRNALFEESAKEFAKVSSWIMEHCERSALIPGGLGEAIYSGADSGDITEEEAGMLVRSLLTAGVDTTVAALGNALLAFAENPEQWDLLHQDPSLAKQAFEETLRFDGVVQTFYRTTTREVEIGDVKLGKHEKVLCFFASANRDPRRWDDPDTLNIMRPNNAHIAFGAGIHRCVGQRVAQMEGEIILRKLAERVKKIELTGPAERRLNNALHTLGKLPLKLTAA
jgi:4-methoxybenzoate monooxygenase (O-demethylating)